jgi:hypothetical protein
VWTLYNYGADVMPPAFEFVKDEDLQTDRAKRDAKLYAMDWRPKKSYIAREYEIPEEDFDIAGRRVFPKRGTFRLFMRARETGSTETFFQK